MGIFLLRSGGGGVWDLPSCVFFTLAPAVLMLIAFI